MLPLRQPLNPLSFQTSRYRSNPSWWVVLWISHRWQHRMLCRHSIQLQQRNNLTLLFFRVRKRMKIDKLFNQLAHKTSCFYPSALRAGGVLSSRSGWAGGCQSYGTHISVTARRNFFVRSSVELSRPVVVHCHAVLPICPIWACPWAKNLSNLPQIGSRFCGMHISETAGWI